ncbi:hypothetical protein OROMI_018327 [Orobanche minor]
MPLSPPSLFFEGFPRCERFFYLLGCRWWCLYFGYISLLKGLNLNGTLPEEFVNLTHLREDLTRNYLNGSIPRIFGQFRLVTYWDRLTGTFPEEVGNITTLETLALADNLFEGNLPAGRSRNLMTLQLSANNFDGTILETYGNMRNLILTGVEFLEDYLVLLETGQDLLDYLQGTLMEGRIPATISLLRNLTELRMSDLRGPSMSFPNLQDMTVMLRLILRNCSITGPPIPPYLGNMTQLRLLFLSNNSLTGRLPDWIMDRRDDYMDLFYNNFTESHPVSCDSSNINLYVLIMFIHESVL